MFANIPLKPFGTSSNKNASQLIKINLDEKQEAEFEQKMTKMFSKEFLDDFEILDEDNMRTKYPKEFDKLLKLLK